MSYVRVDLEIKNERTKLSCEVHNFRLANCENVI